MTAVMPAVAARTRRPGDAAPSGELSAAATADTIAGHRRHPRSVAHLAVKHRNARRATKNVVSLARRRGATMKSLSGRRIMIGGTVRATTEDPVGQGAGVITHPKFRMWLRPDGIAVVVWVPRTTALLEDAVACLEATAQVTGGRRCPLLVNMLDTGPQDRKTRAEWTRRSDLLSAVALVVSTPLSRVVGNLFLSVSRPPFPVRLFDNEASALTWLRDFVG
jgi:hypothetical protein